ncbi:MAG: hypothetical protein M3509_11235 [Chloroflexota bacterium]|nr:hypothetical protein [Chloroflexota bacterium]
MVAQGIQRDVARDRLRARTPLRCPICRSELVETIVRDLGGVTADLVWQLHAGRCPEHGWFQAEVISRPPREIFAVHKPFGVARRVIVEGHEVFAFPTVWNNLPPERQRQRVDPFDAQYWQVEKPTASR